MKVNLYGPIALAGIGQVMKKYANLLGSPYYEFGQPAEPSDIGIAFVLPVDGIINVVKQYATLSKRMIYLTICETEPVHEDYQKLFVLGDTFYVASEFCSQILKKQFPQGNFPLLRLYAYPPREISPIDIPDIKDKFIFYHIGNIIDPRKNINKLIECFIRAQLPNSILLLKATCKEEVSIKIPNIIIVNGMLSEAQLESIHNIGHCYVSMAHSEGAGMGAIEAAMHHKPVIVPEFGATKEYIDTPWLVPCARKTVGIDDFLFQKDFVWGDPDPVKMIEFMKEVYEKRPETIHEKTYQIMSKIPIELKNILAQE